MAKNLITKAEYKAYKGINSTTQDASIDSIIPKVSAFIKNICKRSFIDYVDEPKIEVFKGGQFLLPSETPVLQILSLECSFDYGNTYTELVEYTDFVLDAEEEHIVPIGLTEFPNMVNGYKVSYLAGYENLPEDLKIATMDLVEYYLRNDGAVHSPKAPGTNSVQIEYISTTNLPAHIKRVLDLYMSHYG